MSETKPSTAVVVAAPPAAIQVGQARGLPTGQEIDVMRVIAGTVVVAQGMVPDWIKTQEQALAVMIAGHEMGLAPMTALRHVYIVNGKTDFDAQILMGLVKAGDPTADFEFERYDAEGCVVVLHRAGRRPLRVSYVKADAEASGQLKPKQRKKYAPDDWEWNAQTKRNQLKRGARSIGWEDIPGPWQLYPRDMYAWAAIKRAGRLGAPEVINGLPTHSVRELVDVTPKWVEAPDPTKALNPGDDGQVSPVVAAVVETADPETGEIYHQAGQDGEDGADYVMPDETHTDDDDAAASAIQDDQAANSEGSPPEDVDQAAVDALNFDDLVDRIRELFDDFRGTQETATVQKLVMRIWAKWPATRGEDKNLHLELIGQADAPALRDWLAEAQRQAGIPD